MSQLGPQMASAIRTRLVSLALVAAFGVIAAKAGAVALFSPGEESGVASVFEEPVRRADIIDRNGELLATSVSVYSLFADPRAIWDARDVTRQLSEIFDDLDTDALERRLSDRDRAFVWVRRGLTPRQRQAVFDLGLEGLGFRRESRRAYPRGTLAGHVLGYAGADGQGLAGVEFSQEKRLAEGGEPLRLSIDSNIQFALEAELAAAAGEYEAEGGAGVILQARSGEVLGLASWPPIDPNRALSMSSGDPARRNRAVNSVYELGSVFKPLTIAAGLDSGVIRPTDQFDVSRPLMIGRREINDDHHMPSPMTPSDIVRESSNIGTAKIALMLGARRQEEFLGKLGLLERSPVELSGSAAPILPPHFDEIYSATVGYGHGMAVTPVALAAAYSALANSGEIITPTVLLRPEDDRVPSRVMSALTADLVVHMLRQVVVNGTGRQAEVAGYRIAGKTGTAEKPIQGGYSAYDNICTFASVFPADSPQYVVVVMLDSPKAAEGRGRSAAWNSAPTVGRVVERIAPMLGVEPRFEDLRPAGPKMQSVADQRTSL